MSDPQYDRVSINISDIVQVTELRQGDSIIVLRNIPDGLNVREGYRAIKQLMREAAWDSVAPEE